MKGPQLQRRCAACKEVKPIIAFYNSNLPCRECQKKKSLKSYYATSPEKRATKNTTKRERYLATRGSATRHRWEWTTPDIQQCARAGCVLERSNGQYRWTTMTATQWFKAAVVPKCCAIVPGMVICATWPDVGAKEMN